MNQPSVTEETIYHAALQFPDADQRSAYLDRACAGNLDLRQRIERLLQAGVQARQFFAQHPPPTLSESSPTLEGELLSEQPGDRLGRYKLLQEIGEGGCGVVYMAEQEEPVRRKVALKIIKQGMDTKSVIARFEAERQALALMDHPNIAKVLDAGATETGRPYFVMELIRGIRITDYCDQNNLPTRQRLDLFIQVCHAIQHAHQKGIIHRDIKPSNILVSLHDGVPVPVVIDFGIAKATEQRLTEKTLFTAFVQFIGTPAYTSPEQAEMSRLDIDTRSDIYSLGVLLYELLTGQTPFDAKELLAAGLDQMRQTIREKEPARPSTRLNTLQREELTTTAKRRGTEPPRLIHLVRGDLDWIVMKCLEKDRTRRYETANGLAQDIERHLKQEPVMARPASTSYRIQQFVRRNKMMVAAGAGIGVALLLGTVVSTWQAARATRAELLARQNAYAADINLADTAWRENNLGQATAALRRQIPRAGETDLRGIEWRYLWHKCQGQQSKIFQHETEVLCADLSPDGRWLATVSGGAFWIWDTTRPGERRALSAGVPHDPRIIGTVPGEHLAFDPQGRFLATATGSEVAIWNIADWRKVRSLPATNANLSFSGDGATLATVGWEGIQLWATATWDLKVKAGELSIPGGPDNIRRIALNRDGSWLAASWQFFARPESLAQGEVMLWNIPQRELLFKSSGLDIVKMAFSEDEQRLAACTLGPPAMVWLWSVPEGKPVARWRSSEGLGHALAVAPGGRVLAVAGSDQSIRLFEVGQTNRTPRLLGGHTNEICSLKFAADGRLVSASKDRTVRIWDIRQDPSSQPFSLPAKRLVCAPNAQAQRIVTVNLTNLTFEHWDIESGQCLRQRSMQGAEAILPHGTNSSEPPLQDDLVGNWLIVRGLPYGDSRVRVLLTFEDSKSPAWDLRAVTGDGRAYAWNAESGELVHSDKVAPTLGPAVYPVADHKKLVLLEDSKVTFSSYDLRTHQRERFPDHIAIYSSKPAVSPNSRFFAYFTTSGQVKVWDAISKRTQSIVTLPVENTATAFSPDSRWLAVANRSGRVQVFDLDTGQSVSGPLAGYLANTVRVDFSADGKSLVTYSRDGTAKIWNIATGREMISGLRLNNFLTDHLPTRLLPLDGNSIFESAGEGAIRLVRLPTLAEIDARENGLAKGP